MAIVRNADLMIQMHEDTGACEFCNRTDQRLEVHHIWAKGIGGGSRMDVPINLIVVCKPCHDLAHKGDISRRELFGIAAEREVMKLRNS